MRYRVIHIHSASPLQSRARSSTARFVSCSTGSAAVATEFCLRFAATRFMSCTFATGPDIDSGRKQAMTEDPRPGSSANLRSPPTVRRARVGARRAVPVVPFRSRCPNPLSSLVESSDSCKVPVREHRPVSPGGSDDIGKRRTVLSCTTRRQGPGSPLSACMARGVIITSGTWSSQAPLAESFEVSPRACAAGDLAAVLALYQDDAIAVWPGQGNEATGKAAIEKMAAKLCTGKDKSPPVLKSVEGRALGTGYVVTNGRWELATKATDGTSHVARSALLASPKRPA